MTMRLRISTPPMRAGVRRMFMGGSISIYSVLPRAPPLVSLPRLRGRAGGGEPQTHARADLPPPGALRARPSPASGGGLSSKRLHLAAVHVDGGAVQPAAARRAHEGDQAGDVLRGAEARHADVVAMPFAHGCFVLAG